MSGPLLAATDLARHYRRAGGLFGGLVGNGVPVRALDGVSFTLMPGKTLAVVGESGSGKSTLGRLVALLEPPTRGSLLLDSAPTIGVASAQRRVQRRQIQMVFQNPYGSLNPRKSIGQALAEPLAINRSLTRAERSDAVADMMRRVGLAPEYARRYPHMFSGGQRQRIAIARALMLRPRLVVADEPVSALDLSIQAQVLNLLMELQESFGLAYLFISHDLAVIRHVADELLVLYLGRAVEQGPAARLLDRPAHPYTRALIASRPLLGQKMPPPPSGEPVAPAREEACAFHPRCPFAVARCRAERPELRLLDERLVACHRAEELSAG
jgi:dipeptide transport system ATP-binding protein